VAKGDGSVREARARGEPGKQSIEAAARVLDESHAGTFSAARRWAVQFAFARIARLVTRSYD
jgi:hypothetical protein